MDGTSGTPVVQNRDATADNRVTLYTTRYVLGIPGDVALISLAFPGRLPFARFISPGGQP